MQSKHCSFRLHDIKKNCHDTDLSKNKPACTQFPVQIKQSQIPMPMKCNITESRQLSKLSIFQLIWIICIAYHLNIANADQGKLFKKNQICFYKLANIFIVFLFVVVLLDTTREATLEWTRYPYGPQAQTPGVCIQTFVSS